MNLKDFEAELTAIDDADPLADRQYVVGDTGTLAERLGPEKAREYVRANSLSHFTRVRAARRMGSIASRPI